MPHSGAGHKSFTTPSTPNRTIKAPKLQSSTPFSTTDEAVHQLKSTEAQLNHDKGGHSSGNTKKQRVENSISIPKVLNFSMLTAQISYNNCNG